MRRAIRAVLLAAAFGVAGAAGDVAAQVSQPRDAPPQGGDAPQAASPSGARYIPGVGFRFVAPARPQVYGYYATGPRVYGYADREASRYRHRVRRSMCDRDDPWRCRRR